MPSCRPTAYQGRADGSGDPSGHSGSIPGSIRSETGRGPVGGVMGLAAESERGQVALQLELGDVAAVLVPLLALVAQEEVEHVLAERLGDEFAGLHHVAGA